MSLDVLSARSLSVRPRILDLHRPHSYNFNGRSVTHSDREPISVDRRSRRWLIANTRLLAHQVEIYFSVVQRKVLTPNDFADLAEVQSRLAAFGRRYEQTAAPSSGSSPAAISPSCRTARRQARLQDRGLRLEYVIGITV